MEHNAMDELFSRIKHVNQNVPRGITEVLKILSNPEIIQWTEEWLNEEFQKIEETCENCYPGCSGECQEEYGNV